MFSSKSLTVSGLRFKVLVHFEVYFVNDISWGPILFCMYLFSFPSTFIGKIILLQWVFLAALSILVDCMYMHGFISGLSILFH